MVISFLTNMYEISKTIILKDNLIDPLKNPRNYFLLKTK